METRVGELASLLDAVGELEGLLRLRTRPVAIRFCEDAAQLEDVRDLRRLGRTATFCQVVGLARIGGWTVGVEAADLLGGCPSAPPGGCASIFGLARPLDAFVDGTAMTGRWFHYQEDARVHQQAVRRVPLGRYHAIVVAPLAAGNVEPDVVAVYATPGQVMLLMNALQWEGYKPMQLRFVGESSCSDGIPTCLLTGEPAGTVPCYAERRYGGVAEDELMMALPPSVVEKAVKGIKGLASAGIRYPVLPYGPQSDPTPALLSIYGDKVKQASERE